MDYDCDCGRVGASRWNRLMEKGRGCKASTGAPRWRNRTDFRRMGVESAEARSKVGAKRCADGYAREGILCT